MAYIANPENPANFFSMAGEAAKIAATWPLQQYLYNPGMYSVTRGQVRAPFSGQGLKKLGRTMRHLPGGSKAVDWVRRTFDIDTSSNVMRSKEVWWGLTGDKSRFQFGLNAVVDKPSFSSIFPDDWEVMGRKAYKSPQKLLGYNPKFKVSYQKQLIYRPSPPAGGFPKPLKQALLEYKPSGYNNNIPYILSDMDIKKFTMRNTTPIGADPRGAARQVRNAREALRTPVGVTSGVTKGELFRGGLYKFSKKPKWYNLAYGGFGGGKKAAVGLGRLGVKAGILGMKGFAYYQVGKLMWDAINFIMEPVGRASVQAVDSAFRAYESVPQIEMGGSISMAYLTHGAATERQKSINAISKAHINGRSAFGSEAGLMHK